MGLSRLRRGCHFVKCFICPTLQIDLKKGKQIPLVGVLEGPEFAAYLHQVNLAIKDVGSADTVVAFTDSEKCPDLVILGRRGFFEHFIIKFEEYNKQIEIEPRR